MPGYSVEWGHKTPKSTIAKTNQPTVKPIVKGTQTVSIPSTTIAVKKVNSQATSTVKWKLPAAAETSVSLHPQKSELNHIASNSQKSITSTNTVKESVNGKPVFYTGDEEQDDNARKSMVYGILSLGIPAITFLIMLGIALSVGDTLAEAPAYALTIFAIGCLGGIIFGVFAIIDGFIAISEIHAQPDTFSGTGQAVTGIILGAMGAIAAAVYLAIKYIF